MASALGTEQQALSGALNSEDDTHALAAAVGYALRGESVGVVMALEGNLGAGKSFFTRSLLRAQGVDGAIRSPTYTLIEPYDCDLGRVLHLDLYRLADPDEMLFLGLEEQQAEAALTLVEWPEKAAGYWPAFDLVLKLTVEAEGRQWELSAQTDRGWSLLEKLHTR